MTTASDRVFLVRYRLRAIWSRLKTYVPLYRPEVYLFYYQKPGHATRWVGAFRDSAKGWDVTLSSDLPGEGWTLTYTSTKLR